MSKSKLLLIIAVLGIGILVWVFTGSPFARQARLENKLQNEMNAIQLPSGLQFQRREDSGDVVLGSESDWKVYFVYSCSESASTIARSLNQAFINAGYSSYSTSMNSEERVFATNKTKGISIDASICSQIDFGSTRIEMREL